MIEPHQFTENFMRNVFLDDGVSNLTYVNELS